MNKMKEQPCLVKLEVIYELEIPAMSPLPEKALFDVQSAIRKKLLTPEMLKLDGINPVLIARSARFEPWEGDDDS